MANDDRNPFADQPGARLRDAKGKPHWVITGTNANLKGLGIFTLFLGGIFAVCIVVLDRIF